MSYPTVGDLLDYLGQFSLDTRIALDTNDVDEPGEFVFLDYALRELQEKQEGEDRPLLGQGSYLLVIHDDVEPEVLGPFDTPEARDAAARDWRKNRGDGDGIYMLEIDAMGTPTVDSYSGAFFEEGA